MPSPRTPRTRSRQRLLAGIAAGSLIVATGCSTSSDSDAAAAGGGELSAAQQECVDNANAYLDDRGLLPESIPEELTPLSKPPTEGLTITYVHLPSPSAVETAQHLVDIAPEIGWTGKAVTYDGSVEDANRKLLAAIDDSDVVLTLGLPPAAAQDAIRAAEEKGVLLMLDAVEPPQSVPGFGGTPLGGDLYNKMGEPGANMVMQATNCQGNVAVFGLPFDAMHNLADGVQQGLEASCEDCTSSYTDIPLSALGSPAATNAVVSKLQSDPSIDFAFFTTGDLAIGIEPALKQAGLDAQIGGAIPVSQNLAALQRGDNAFWLGVPHGTSPWLILDTAVRALDSGQPTVGNHYPVPVFTPDNIESTDPIPVYPTDIGDQFKELWQVG
ncbi:sugar ABC transporter substrate-binding protein [Geodermatophilus sabuli]|uniref:ABC-type sugar transport system, substrate-binding protein, contains N-terminal xre family HTH domain n=1 Tax=Geodermatophilus sabuli TaxID=1564158 RepID=A0A285EA64_9ACTN|nr:sugar ABC transporter substrate-binding protein [Geodermatophilus sabuli]MBB3085559.1 ABC-type sugar transport system substrate-binding protein [Geodermatophilus sabuli]SNX96019.1 ABC-type sugar transport system, substrate-binding protein, contains N-terminal xre family HTH domain [Geodermatophilus sabuli]